VARGEVHEVGRREPEIDNVGTRKGGAFDEGGHQRLAGRARVPTHQDARVTGEPDERIADTTRNGFVDLVGIDAAYVVRLEDRVELSCHARAPGRTPWGEGPL